MAASEAVNHDGIVSVYMRSVVGDMT